MTRAFVRAQTIRPDWVRPVSVLLGGEGLTGCVFYYLVARCSNTTFIVFLQTSPPFLGDQLDGNLPEVRISIPPWSS